MTPKERKMLAHAIKGDNHIQKLYSEQLTLHIFGDESYEWSSRVYANAVAISKRQKELRQQICFEVASESILQGRDKEIAEIIDLSHNKGSCNLEGDTLAAVDKINSLFHEDYWKQKALLTKAIVDATSFDLEENEQQAKAWKELEHFNYHNPQP